MLWPGPDSACFYLDPSAGLTDGGLWKDSSRFGLHCTPVGYAAPNWGYSLGPSGAPRITFDGAAQRGDILAPSLARFYAAANNTSILTIAAVVRSNAPADNDRIFSCVAPAGRGFALRYFNVSRMSIDAYDGAGALGTMIENAGVGATTSRTNVMVLSFDKVGVLGRAWRDRDGNAITIGGAATAIGYDAAQVPQLGTWAGVANYFDGDLYFLGIWPLVFTDSEARAFSAFWMDRT